MDNSEKQALLMELNEALTTGVAQTLNEQDAKINKLITAVNKLAQAAPAPVPVLVPPVYAPEPEGQTFEEKMANANAGLTARTLADIRATRTAGAVFYGALGAAAGAGAVFGIQAAVSHYRSSKEPDVIEVVGHTV